jgi:cytochrome c biogenesis protein CcmG, thiol:disulfide interchange protein DsbE
VSDAPPEDAGADGAGSRRRGLLFALPVLAFAGLAAVFLGRLASGADPSTVPSALLGRPVPAFALPPLPGLTGPQGPLPGLASGDLKGRVTVVNVWASWCAPCQVEHPQLVQLGRSGVTLVGIDYKDQAENGRRFLGRNGNPFSAVGFDADGRTAIDWGVYGVPETYIVGPDGTIRARHVGPLTAETLPAFLAKVRAADTGS